MWLLGAWLPGCSDALAPPPQTPEPAAVERAAAPEPGPTPPNVLLVILDDVGVDKVAAYGEVASAPATPTLSALAAEGVVFRNAWSHPYCSATRAAIQTGRYAGHTGIGYVVFPERADQELDPSEVTIPEMLALAPQKWDSSLVGKWHLGTGRSGRVLDHAGRQGFAWWASTDDNLHGPDGYVRWTKNLNGTPTPMTRYATTDQADDTIARTRAMAEPWFLTLAFNAAHAPLHVPPDGLGGTLGAAPPSADTYDAMLVAADAELGRVLASMEPGLRSRTVVVVIGDNGTMELGVRPPNDPKKAKGTVWEGGVNVPLLISGPIVAHPGESRALVHAVDLFPTLAELAGVDVATLPNAIDGRSLVPALKDLAAPVHRLLFTEQFQPNGDPAKANFHARVVRGERFKLMVVTRGGKTTESLYDLRDARIEGVDLLGKGPLPEDAAKALQLLRGELGRQSPRDRADADAGRKAAPRPKAIGKEGGPAKAKRNKGG